MEHTMNPSDADMDDLREQVNTHRRQREYQQLSAEIHQNHQAVVIDDQVLEGELQNPDRAQVLKTKRRASSFVEMVLRRLMGMLSFKPVIGNIIAVGLAMLALYYVYQEVDLDGFSKYRHYFGMGIQIFAAIQIIKSGTRSLLLPLLAMVGGSMMAHSLGPHETLLTFGKTFYEYVIITGIIGLGMSVLTID